MLVLSGLSLGSSYVVHVCALLPALIVFSCCVSLLIVCCVSTLSFWFRAVVCIMVPSARMRLCSIVIVVVVGCASRLVVVSIMRMCIIVWCGVVFRLLLFGIDVLCAPRLGLVCARACGC